MSPLIEQYQSIKARYSDAIVLFWVGDYYEIFGADAIRISETLSIALTESTIEEVKVTAGFPFSALNSYLRTLIKAGYRVVICEQLEDPKRAKGTVKRGVSDFLKP